MTRIYNADRTTGSDGRHYVQGPGNGFGYDAGTLFPECRLSSAEDAAAAANLANEAYRQGRLAAQHDMRKALGIQ